MLLALISDIHNGPNAYHRGELRKLGEDAIDLVENFVSAMNRIIKPDLVINLGDVVEDETAEDDERHYYQVMAAFNELDCGVLHLTGNHDEIHLRPEQLAAMRGAWAVKAPTRVGDYEILTLATHSNHKRTWIEDDELDSLKAQLAANDSPALLFMHHPVAEQDLTGNHWFEKAPHLALVDRREAVREIIESSGRVKAVFNGHVHWNHLGEHAGIPYVTIQSLVENISEPGDTAQPAAAWATAEVGVDGMVVEVRGWDAVDYTFSW